VSRQSNPQLIDREREIAVVAHFGRWLAVACIGLMLATAFMGILALASPALAESEPYAEEDYREVVDQLGCIQCNMRPLFGCETPTCLDSKALIRQKLAAGESPDDIVQFFVDRYGDSILLNPPARGLNLLIWVLPAVALLAGAFGIGRVIGRRRTPTRATYVSSIDDEYESRVEEELRAIQRGRG
jgi:cytochrome c-type biogenesis protein CcmH